PLENEIEFKSAKVEYGVIVWHNGDIDIAPEYIYKNSYVYNEIIIA
ncbi:MAG: hypothetical protein K0S04_2322, partial [Herbinix sp.]|nr:hypothetical protein [Herbinix sp.]